VTRERVGYEPPDSTTRRSDGNEEKERCKEVILEVSWKEVVCKEVQREEELGQEEERDEARSECSIHEADDTERAAWRSCRNKSVATHGSHEETLELHQA
jgi:hypothetical protein